MGEFGVRSSENPSEVPGGNGSQWRLQAESDGFGDLARSSKAINISHPMEELTVCSMGVHSEETTATTDSLSGKTNGGKANSGKQKALVEFLNDSQCRLEASEPMNFVDTISGSLHGSVKVNDIVSKEKVVHNVSVAKASISATTDSEPIKSKGKCIFQRWNQLSKNSAAKCVVEKKKELAECREVAGGRR
ncbi:hypothetical protein LWI29_025529 [Acer saccharum]|uniref:Uncharacterized protein n=1 Tax=Acer saccharum TaxID=4024 RepID=A0AA39SYY6_ACESA|nr:hypothetical protein LWI29_025529 [Acer saccharum]